MLLKHFDFLHFSGHKKTGIVPGGQKYSKAKRSGPTIFTPAQRCLPTGCWHKNKRAAQGSSFIVSVAYYYICGECMEDSCPLLFFAIMSFTFCGMFSS
jgi:hypothetical protein